MNVLPNHAHLFSSGSGVDVSAVQRRDEPTRDVYVTRDDRGDREFAGVGRYGSSPGRYGGMQVWGRGAGVGFRVG